jgi:hypothetical protein
MDLAAESVFNYSLPRMMASCCTRATVERIKEKYGSLFFSDAPDFNFAYTCLTVEDSILFYDYPLTISYGFRVSNGTTFNRGVFNKESTTKDFIKTTKFAGINGLVSRLPLSTTKIIASEYVRIKKDSELGSLKELNEDKLLRNALSYVIFYEDSREKLKALREIYAINKMKFPVHLAYTYFTAYKLRGMTKLKSKMGSEDAFDIMKRHQSLAEAMTEIINHPRASTNSRDFFDIRIGRFPRELEMDLKPSPGGADR